MPIYRRHGVRSVGWWAVETKDATGRGQFVCLLAGDDEAAISRASAAFHADPEWRRVELETESEGPLRVGVTAWKLRATDFSSLK